MVSKTTSAKDLTALLQRPRQATGGLLGELTTQAGMSEIQIARQGVAAVIVKTVVEKLFVGKRFVSEFTTIPRSTFYAKVKGNKTLAPTEADRVLTSLKVIDRATKLFEGDRDAALRWLTQPHRLLGGDTPKDRAKTSVGADQVHKLIGRIEHGNAA